MLSEFIHTLNQWGHHKVPFLFFVDFEMENPMAFRLDKVDDTKILFDINGFSNSGSIPSLDTDSKSFLEKFPYGLSSYKEKFDSVVRHLAYGDSFLTNLTIRTKVNLQHSLKQLFFISKAKYKLWYDDKFLVFSPETFVQVRDGKIFSYPMKGTIDATLPGAQDRILRDQKELAEHVTIVDLIRNDLSQVAANVSVKRFRYVEELRTNNKNLLQVSSEIVGDLPNDHLSHLGNIIVKLLPAGSVSGAPKPKTLEVIKEAEQMKRGYYTGIVGYFDGTQLDSGVMIRFIENTQGAYYYRSGGGITSQSVVESEYQEVMDKVYVPVD